MSVSIDDFDLDVLNEIQRIWLTPQWHTFAVSNLPVMSEVEDLQEERVSPVSDSRKCFSRPCSRTMDPVGAGVFMSVEPHTSILESTPRLPMMRGALLMSKAMSLKSEMCEQSWIKVVWVWLTTEWLGSEEKEGGAESRSVVEGRRCEADG